MSNPDLIDSTRQIVAQDEAIRKALHFGHGPEYFVSYYLALSEHKKTAFVAAMAAALSQEHSRKKIVSGKINSGVRK